MPSLFPAPLTFWTLSICPHLGHPHPHAGPVKCHSSNQLPPGLPGFSVWLALTLPSPGAALPRALTHVSFLAPACCPQPQPVAARSHCHVEPQVLAMRTGPLQLQSEPSLRLASVPLFLPLVGDREETDWGHKTHQVFNRWLSENGMPTQQLAAACSMVAGLRKGQGKGGWEGQLPVMRCVALLMGGRSPGLWLHLQSDWPSTGMNRQVLFPVPGSSESTALCHLAGLCPPCPFLPCPD